MPWRFPVSLNVQLNGFRFFGPDSLSSGRTLLSAATQSYGYEHVCVASGQTIALPSWPRVIVFVPHGSGAVLRVGEATIQRGDSLSLSGAEKPEVKCTAGEGTVLLSGGGAVAGQADQILTRAGDHYKVTKPWGHELWLNGEDPIFNFKEVFIKAGNQTSLQYHHFKEETNFLYSGTADLIYKSTANVLNDDVQPGDLGTLAMVSPTCVHMIPGVLHRLRATTDLYLYETATPFLDDVIRVQDDSRRRDGRVAAEHGAAISA